MIDAEKFIKAMELTVLSPSTNTRWDVRSAELNRPGLQFVGYFDYFAYERPQVIGKVEMAYLDSLSEEQRIEMLKHFFSFPMPCIIICRGLRAPEELLDLAAEHNVPVLATEAITTKFFVRAINYLSRELAPRSTLHGVLVDVYGVGVLITGESGVGKSETALELVKRGHQLVADDVVDICRVNDSSLEGQSPENIRHFMEIRGIGIIDIRAMYGISAVLTSRSIDMVIHLEPWKEKKSYDRLGLSEDFTTIMDVKVPQIVLPVRPGRNLAIVVEVAARNFSLKQMGYSAAKELDRRLTEMMNSAGLQ